MKNAHIDAWRRRRRIFNVGRVIVVSDPPCLALPEGDGDHPVLHGGLPRHPQRPQRRGVPHPHAERRRLELEVSVPTLRGVPPTPRRLVVPGAAASASAVLLPPDVVLLAGAYTRSQFRST